MNKMNKFMNSAKGDTCLWDVSRAPWFSLASSNGGAKGMYLALYARKRRKERVMHPQESGITSSSCFLYESCLLYLPIFNLYIREPTIRVNSPFSFSLFRSDTCHRIIYTILPRRSTPWYSLKMSRDPVFDVTAKYLYKFFECGNMKF